MRCDHRVAEGSTSLNSIDSDTNSRKLTICAVTVPDNRTAEWFTFNFIHTYTRMYRYSLRSVVDLNTFAIPRRMHYRHYASGYLSRNIHLQFIRGPLGYEQQDNLAHVFIYFYCILCHAILCVTRPIIGHPILSI